VGCGRDYTLFAMVDGTVNFTKRRDRKLASVVAKDTSLPPPPPPSPPAPPPPPPAPPPPPPQDSGAARRIKPVIIGIIGVLIVLFLLFGIRQCKPSKTDSAEPLPAPIPVEEALTPPVINEPVVKVPLFQVVGEAIFVGDSSDLLPDASRWLDETAEKMRQILLQNPDQKFKVIGYAAIVPGFPEPNDLSRRRAIKTIGELVNRAIPAEKLEPVVGGETAQWGDNTSTETRLSNRRVEIIADPKSP
jgi:outer membrane protein OmpA-like peptidoglycan-associated protein